MSIARLSPARNPSAICSGVVRSGVVCSGVVRPGVVAALAVAALSACVVIPIDPKTGQPYPVTTTLTPPPVVVVQQPPSMPQNAGMGTGYVGASVMGANGMAGNPGVVNARLYPANEAARVVGLLAATVLDNGQGRGTFSVVYGQTPLSGEATRIGSNYPGFGQLLAQVSGGGVNWAAASGQRGIANAAGGNLSLRCEYLFSRPTQGTGACVGSDGAHFQIHFGG